MKLTTQLMIYPDTPDLKFVTKRSEVPGPSRYQTVKDLVFRSIVSTVLHV